PLHQFVELPPGRVVEVRPFPQRPHQLQCGCSLPRPSDLVAEGSHQCELVLEREVLSVESLRQLGERWHWARGGLGQRLGQRRRRREGGEGCCELKARYWPLIRVVDDLQRSDVRRQEFGQNRIHLRRQQRLPQETRVLAFFDSSVGFQQSWRHGDDHYIALADSLQNSVPPVLSAIEQLVEPPLVVEHLEAVSQGPQRGAVFPRVGDEGV